LPGVEGLGGDGELLLMYRDFFLEGCKCLNIRYGDGCTTLNILKTTELYILNWGTVLCVNCISIKLLFL